MWAIGGARTLFLSLGGAAAVTFIAAILAHYDGPLAAGLMIGAVFYLAGFTGLAIARALGAGLHGRIVFGIVTLALGSVSVASSLLITAIKTYAKYIP